VKSFSASTFASEHPEEMAVAAEVIKKNPQALFTDFQWFLYRAQNTVYFTAYSENTLDKDALMELVGQLVTLAPQLTHGFAGAKPGHPLPKHLLDAITSVEEVDDFDGFPNKWLEPGLEVFEKKGLPLFRVKAAARRGGQDAEGRGSIIMVRSSHALMEGSDSALLARSQNAGHGSLSSKTNKVPISQRLKYMLIAALAAPVHLIAALIATRNPVPMAFETVVLERAALRQLSSKLGIKQRSLMFALVMAALFDNEVKKGKPRKLKTSYTMLDSNRVDADDDFFRVNAVDAPFIMDDDLAVFAKNVDASVAETEAKDVKVRQLVINAMFKTHRFLSRIIPFAYSPRFFRYNGGYDAILTMVPPHRLYGNLTHGMMEPVFCGSYHPGSTLCTFVPARKYVTLNFSMPETHIPRVPRIKTLIEKLQKQLT